MFPKILLTTVPTFEHYSIGCGKQDGKWHFDFLQFAGSFSLWLAKIKEVKNNATIEIATADCTVYFALRRMWGRFEDPKDMDFDQFESLIKKPISKPRHPNVTQAFYYGLQSFLSNVGIPQASSESLNITEPHILNLLLEPTVDIINRGKEEEPGPNGVPLRSRHSSKTVPTGRNGKVRSKVVPE